jgi:hypothetical protein
VSVYRSDPAAPGANLRRRQVDSSAERLDRAVEGFNAGAAARTVAGLTRSLGQPRVSVGTAAGSSSQVRITVAWELCWYQWAVDTAGGGQAVTEIGRGEDVEQLDRSARQWNARVGEGAQLVFGSAGLRPRPRIGWLRRR